MKNPGCAHCWHYVEEDACSAPDNNTKAKKDYLCDDQKDEMVAKPSVLNSERLCPFWTGLKVEGYDDGK